MLLLAGRAHDAPSARALLDEALGSGKALRVFERMVTAQGGDARAVSDPQRLEVARSVPVLAAESGFVVAIDAFELGLVAVALGAGRTRADQRVDPAVGLSIEAKPGARVAPGEALAHIHVRDPRSADAVHGRVLRAFQLSDAPRAGGPLILGRVGA
jgi:thymidine phosphorylase